jgi:hypothetical protein
MASFQQSEKYAYGSIVIYLMLFMVILIRKFFTFFGHQSSFLDFVVDAVGFADFNLI